MRLITISQTTITDKLITFTCIRGENYSFSVTGIFENFCLAGGGDFSVSKREFPVALKFSEKCAFISYTLQSIDMSLKAVHS